MSNLHKMWIIIIVIGTTSLVGSFGVVNEKQSLNELLKGVQYVNISTLADSFKNSPYSDQVKYSNRITQLNNLEEQSEGILVIKVISRKLYYDAVQTKCRIVNVFKTEGKNEKIGDTIYIYERFIAINIKGDIILSLNSTLLPMSTEGSYLVFLNRINGYDEKNHFNLSSTTFGVIPVKEKIIVSNIEKIPTIEKGRRLFEFFKSTSFVYISGTEIDFQNAQKLRDKKLSELEIQKSFISENDYFQQMSSIEESFKSQTYLPTYRTILEEVIKDALLKYTKLSVSVMEQ